LLRGITPYQYYLLIRLRYRIRIVDIKILVSLQRTKILRRDMLNEVMVTGFNLLIVKVSQWRL